MSKNKLRIYFNGEKKEPYRLVRKPNTYFNISSNELVYNTYYYYDYTGSPYRNVASRVLFDDVQDLATMHLIFYKQYNSSGLNSFVLPIRSQCQFLYWANRKDGSSSITLDISIVANDVTFYFLEDNRYIMTINLANLIAHNSAQEPTKNSRLAIVFNRLVASTEDASYLSGGLRFDIQLESSYVEYDDQALYQYNFSRTINANNELPNYGICSSDGSIILIDYNRLIEQRILTDSIRNNLVSEIIFNNTKIARLVGYNANYPYNTRNFTFNIADYLQVFGEIKIDPIVFVSGEPNSYEINAYDLYNLLVEKTKELCEFDFETLEDYIEEYYKDIVFVDPYIDCDNLKDMWEQFLVATMSNMFVNENGSIAVNAYHKADLTKVYNIELDKQQQDIQMNLINNNSIAQVNGYELGYGNNYENLVDERIMFRTGNDLESWVSEAESWDYQNNGDYINPSLNFVIKNYIQRAIYSNPTYYSKSFLIEFEFDLKNTLLGGGVEPEVVINFIRTVVNNNIVSNKELSLSYRVRYFDNETDYDNSTATEGAIDYIDILNITTNGMFSRKAKMLVTYQGVDSGSLGTNRITLEGSSCSILLKSKEFAYLTNIYGSSVPYKNTLDLQKSSLINSYSRYKSDYRLIDYIVQDTYELYENGKKIVEFTTNNFDFVDNVSNSVLKGKNGEILKVGDLFKLIGVSNSTFKITQISASYDGQFSLGIKAIEFKQENSFATKLASPVISISNNVISWVAVANAESYLVFLNNVQVDNLSTLNFNVEDYIDTSVAGNHDFYVVATTSDTDFTSSDPSNIISYNIVKLATPTNLSITNDTLSWSVVANATSYDIYSGNTLVGSSITNSYNLSSLSSIGSYTIRVVAKASGYLDSDMSSSVSYVVSQLSAPTISFDGSNLSWSAISNASAYEIYIDDVLYTTTSNLTYNLDSALTQTKTYTFKVKATSNYNKYKTSAFSNTITYENVLYTLTAYMSASGSDQDEIYITIYGVEHTINVADFHSQATAFTMNVKSGSSITIKTKYNSSGTGALIRYNGTSVAQAQYQATYTFTMSEDNTIIGKDAYLIDCGVPSTIDYSYDNGTLTINNAPYTQSGGDLIVGEE